MNKGGNMVPDLSGVQIKTTHVNRNIYMLEATGDVAGNIGASVGSDGVLLVDTQFAPLADQIRSSLTAIGGKEIRFIINTHCHEDHTHGNTALGQVATLVVHDQTWQLLKKDLNWPLEKIITFDKQKSFHFNGERVDIVHFPDGHTASDSIVVFSGSNVVHVGDLLNAGNWSFPFVDLDAGGSIDGLIQNVKSILDVIPRDAKIIPGHYQITDKEGLKMTYDMLLETSGIVREKKAFGQDLAQIKAEGFPARYDSWGRGYTQAPQWIENIYNGI